MFVVGLAGLHTGNIQQYILSLAAMKTITKIECVLQLKRVEDMNVSTEPSTAKWIVSMVSLVNNKKHSPQCQHLSRIARISRARPRSSTTFTWTNPTSFIHIWLSSSYYSVKLNGDSLIFNPFILPLLSNPKRNLRERWIVMNEPKIVTSPVKKPDYTAET